VHDLGAKATIHDFYGVLYMTYSREVLLYD